MKSRMRFGLLAGVILTTLMLLAAVGCTSEETTAENGSVVIESALRGPDAVIGHAYIDMSAGFEAEDLARSSPLAVVGRIIDARLIEEPSVTDVPISVIGTLEPDASLTPPPGKNPVESLRTISGVYKTEYTLAIESVVGGELDESRKELLIREGGGVVEGQELMFGGFPLYRIGQRYLVFLTQNPLEGSEGTFYTTSGVHGAYLLAEGRVYRAVGENGRWVPYGEKNDAAFVSDVADTASSVER